MESKNLVVNFVAKGAVAMEKAIDSLTEGLNKFQRASTNVGTASRRTTQSYRDTSTAIGQMCSSP